MVVMEPMMQAGTRHLLAGMWIAACLLIGLAGPVVAAPGVQPPSPTPEGALDAVVAVERAVVFSTPSRTAEPLTYVYERERIPIYGQTADGVFLLTTVDAFDGWVLGAQVDVNGDVAQVPVIAATAEGPVTGPTPTQTPLPTVTVTPFRASPTPVTVIPTPTRYPARTSVPVVAADSGETMALLPGVPPPVTVPLPAEWETVDLVVPLRTFDGELHDAPLTIYFGSLADGVTGFVYLYWGFPSTMDYITMEYNPWADGVQILRGSLVGESCNLGLYDQRAFRVGDYEGVGAYYQASECEDEASTAGWFVALRVNDAPFVFYTAVEPWDALNEYQIVLQAILDGVTFSPLDADADPGAATE